MARRRPGNATVRVVDDEVDVWNRNANSSDDEAAMKPAID
jgi:hypothetical protein